MKTLFIECKMGAAGDMLMAALYELLNETQKEDYLKIMNHLPVSNLHVIAQNSNKCGISGTHMKVLIHGTEELPEEHTSSHSHHHDHAGSHEHESHHSHEMHHHHEHYSYLSVLEQISALPLPSEVIAHASAVYMLIGEAEAYVHGTNLEQIHFHEVGSLDALMDVVGCCLLFHMIDAKKIYCSPIHVGNGMVHCAHGILPVPAPATAQILKGIPFYTGDISSELCTPTGAALLRHFVTDFGSMPIMLTDKIGIGLGNKDFPVANCVRIFAGQTDDKSTDTIIDLSCNLDDMTGEDLGYCMELLMSEGALDVFYQAIQMKKNRPGILLHCFCNTTDTDKFIQLILSHTTTRGVRISQVSRAKLSASFEEVETPYGMIHIKINSGYGIVKSKYEFEDIKKIAKENNISLATVRKSL